MWCSRSVGVIIHFLGADVVNKALPPVVTGGVVMVIGFNLAGVATNIYMPADRWMALITMTAVVLMAVGLRGFLGRIAIFLGLIFGYLLSWIFDVIGVGGVEGDRVELGQRQERRLVRLPVGTRWTAWWATRTRSATWPRSAGTCRASRITFALLAMPAVIALIAENMGHVKAVAGMTGRDLDPVMGRAIAADGVGTVITSAVGGSPTTTYAENIGVMAATRVYSTAAYFVAAAVAILLGFIPKFGAIVAATPGGVLAGITLVLYGMIGLLGAKIWVENRVNFADPVNLVPVAAGLTIAIGFGTSGFFEITDDFSLGGIALGTIVIIAGYHLARAIEPRERREREDGRRRRPEIPRSETGPLRILPTRVAHRCGGGPGR